MSWPNFRLSRRQRRDLNAALPVLALGHNRYITREQAMAGFLICGGTGSAKTTSSAARLFLGLARHCGFIVFTVKSGEAAWIHKLATMAGRGADVIVAAPGSGWGLDPIRYLLSCPGNSAADATAMLEAICDSEQASGRGQHDAFWKSYSSRLLFVAIQSILMAEGTAGLRDIQRFLMSLPATDAILASDAWRESYTAITLRKAEANARTVQEQDDARQCLDAVMIEWVRTPEKTKASLLPMFGNVFGKLLTGVIGEFTRLDKLTPSLISEQGKIVILDYPTLIYGSPAKHLQILYKLVMDRHMLRRSSLNALPVVRWCDEASQLFVPGGHDARVQCVARQAKYIAVTIIQDLQSARSAMGGGEAGSQELDGLISNHQTKILHANTCHFTNENWSNLVGKRKELHFGGSIQHAPFDIAAELMGTRTCTATSSFHESYEADLKANTFLTLATGGPANHWTAEAIVIQGNHPEADGRLWHRVAFPQVIA